MVTKLTRCSTSQSRFTKPEKRWAGLALAIMLVSACGANNLPVKSVSVGDPGPLTRETPLDAKQILEDNPLTHASDIYKTNDGELFVAHWSASAGRFTWDYTDINEVITILDGEAFVKTSDGTIHHLQKGSTMVFASGDYAEWRVPTYIRKVAVVQRAPRPFLRRVADKLAKIAGS